MSYFNWKIGAQTETELKEKKLRVEDTLNATKEKSLLCDHNEPESPALLGGKIYEMMGMVLSSRWGTSAQQVNSHSHVPETIEAEEVEPVELVVRNYRSEDASNLHAFV